MRTSGNFSSGIWAKNQADFEPETKMKTTELFEEQAAYFPGGSVPPEICKRFCKPLVNFVQC